MPSLKACRLDSRVMWHWELLQKSRSPAQLRGRRGREEMISSDQ